MPYSKEQVVEMCRKVHGDKYDYSITEGVQNKLGIIRYICPIHGVMEQALHNHLQGKECTECANEKRRITKTPTKEEFLEKAARKHNLSEYDWSEFNILDRDDSGRVEFCCRKHGKYRDWPSNFLKGHGCHICHGKSKDDDEVREELSKLHPELDFSQAKYSERDKLKRIKVICPKHGEQLISYGNLMNGQGCYWCGRERTGMKNTLSNEEIIRRGKELFGEEYTYEHLDTYNRTEDGKITITCRKHGDFTALPANFFKGVGCPICAESSLEMEMRMFLEDNGIKFEPYKKFEWLGKQHLDFYLPEHNIGIECQGMQHFIPVNIFGGQESLDKVKKLDERKRMLCNSNGIRVLYYANEKYDFPYEVYTDKNKLLEEIKRDSV